MSAEDEIIGNTNSFIAAALRQADQADRVAGAQADLRNIEHRINQIDVDDSNSLSLVCDELTALTRVMRSLATEIASINSYLGEHLATMNTTTTTEITARYSPSSRNGWGAYVVTVARDGQELICVKRGAFEAAVEEALRQVREQGLTITRDNTGMGLVGQGRATAGADSTPLT